MKQEVQCATSFLEWLRSIGITIFGAPCAGKTETAERLAGYLRDRGSTSVMVVRDLGQAMRDAHEKNPKHFSKLNGGDLADSGEFLRLVDKVVLSAWRDRCGVVFPGQPRLVTEAEYFLQKGYISLAFLLEAPNSVLIQRARSRGREDDDNIEHRIDVYGKKTQLVLDFFINHGIPVEVINANRNRNEIDKDIMSTLFKHYQRTSGAATQ